VVLVAEGLEVLVVVLVAAGSVSLSLSRCCTRAVRQKEVEVLLFVVVEALVRPKKEVLLLVDPAPVAMPSAGNLRLVMFPLLVKVKTKFGTGLGKTISSGTDKEESAS
jgi:hypothetical protein